MAQLGERMTGSHEVRNFVYSPPRILAAAPVAAFPGSRQRLAQGTHNPWNLGGLSLWARKYTCGEKPRGFLAISLPKLSTVQ